VLRPGGTAGVPIAGAWVTLHRVGKDKAGPIDSMRTDALGRYRFRYQGGDTLSIYFVSSSFGGIAHDHRSLRTLERFDRHAHSRRRRTTDFRIVAPRPRAGAASRRW
jgi:hypothetical protein